MTRMDHDAPQASQTGATITEVIPGPAGSLTVSDDVTAAPAVAAAPAAAAVQDSAAVPATPAGAMQTVMIGTSVQTGEPVMTEVPAFVHEGTQGEPLLSVRNLQKHFPIKGGFFGRTVGSVKAVDGVNFDLFRGEVVGLVGESGSGKTTVGRTLLRLVEPTGGDVIFKGQDVVKMDKRQLREARRDMQIIFQDPFASLDPRMTVEEIIGEALDIHKLHQGAERKPRIAELLQRVGIRPEQMVRYPHEFSGGQRQRIGIARALAVNPDFIVADEPVSALDVSIQAQVVNLLQDLQQELGLTVLFIAHDLLVVEYICDRIIVMYLGKIMEIAPSHQLNNDPQHPYTEALLSAAPVPDPTIKRQRIILEGDIPSPINPPSGCVFRTRCRYAIPQCAEVVPALREVKPGQFKACIRDDIL